MNRPKILVVTTSFAHEVTGREAAGSFVRDFVEKLADYADVVVIAPSLSRQRLQLGRYVVSYFPVSKLPLSTLNPLDPRNWLAILRALRLGKRAVAFEVEQQSFGLVVALWVLPSGYWAKSAAGGVPFVTWALGSDIWSLGRLPVIKAVLRRVLRAAKKNYADGIMLCEDVRKLGGDEVQFLPSSRLLPRVDRKLKRLIPPYRLAFLGRWHPNKGPDILLDALFNLKDSDWAKIEEVRIAGGGPMECQVADKVAQLAGAGRPVFLEGYLNVEQAADFIGRADYLLIPSRVESIPVIFSDALQVGTPMIVTPVGDFPMLHGIGKFGIVAKECTSESFSDAISFAVSGSGGDYSAAITELRKRFSLDEVVKEILRQVD